MTEQNGDPSAPVLDPRAVRVSVAPALQLPGDEPMTVSPDPVPIRPLRGDLTARGPFGGIASSHREEAAEHEAEPLVAGPGPVDPGADNAADDALVAVSSPRHLIVDGRPVAIGVRRADGEHLLVERELSAPAPAGPVGGAETDTGSETFGGERRGIQRVILGPTVRRPADGVILQEVVVDGWRFELEIEPERRAVLRERARRGHETAGHAGPLEIRAIIPGRIVGISVAPGDPVEAGQQLLVLEAMKMQNELRAPREGAIERIAVSIGDTVDVGNLLMVIS